MDLRRPDVPFTGFLLSSMLSAHQEGWLWLRKKVSSRHLQKKWIWATVVVIVMMALIVIPTTSRAIGQADTFKFLRGFLSRCTYHTNADEIWHSTITSPFSESSRVVRCCRLLSPRSFLPCIWRSDRRATERTLKAQKHQQVSIGFLFTGNRIGNYFEIQYSPAVGMHRETRRLPRPEG